MRKSNKQESDYIASRTTLLGNLDSCLPELCMERLAYFFSRVEFEKDALLSCVAAYWNNS